MKTLLERFLKMMEIMCLTISNVLLVLMVAGGMINILVRELLGQGIIWVFQTSIILFAWSIFFGIFAVYRRGADVAVELIVDFFNPLFQRLANLFVSALTIFLFGTILVQAPKLIALQAGLLETIDLPRYVVALPLFFSCVLVILSTLLKASEQLHSHKQPVAH